MENLPIATIRPTSQLHKLVWAGWFLFTSMGSTGCTGVGVPPEVPVPTKVPSISPPASPSQLPPVTTPSVIKGEPLGTLPKSVLWIEKMECKSEHEVWVLYYEGKLTAQSSNATFKVTLNERYALWYDSRQQGESTEDWWCIPRKEFCYTLVKFSDWAGRYRVGQEIRVDDREKMVRDFAKLKELISDKECRG